MYQLRRVKDWKFCSYDVINRLLLISFFFSHTYILMHVNCFPSTLVLWYLSLLLQLFNIIFLSSTSGIWALCSRNWSWNACRHWRLDPITRVNCGYFPLSELEYKNCWKKLVDRVRPQGWPWSLYFVSIGPKDWCENC